MMSIFSLIGLAVVAYLILGTGFASFPLILQLVVYGVGILALLALASELLRIIRKSA